MDIPTSDVTKMTVEEFDTSKLLINAARQRDRRNLNDVLITMGLLRNANIDASSSATAFREATRRLGSDQNAQRAVTEAGVQIFDEQTGAMRSIVDVMQELVEKWIIVD